MVTFRAVVRTDSGMIRGISTPVDLVSAVQHVRYLRDVCGHQAHVVANTKQWTREAEALATTYGTSFLLFPGNAAAPQPVPPAMHDKGSNHAD